MARRKAHDGNYSKVFAWRLAMRDTGGLTPQAVALAFTLSTYMDQNAECFPSQDLLAFGSGLKSARSVNTYLRELVAGEWLEVDARMTPGGRRNTYRGRVPWSKYLAG